MPDRNRKKRCFLALAGPMLLAVTAIVTGCSSGESRTVPVLWAATQSDGTIAGGIEPARVEVQSIGEPGFTLSLEDIAAEGAGEQWQAASSSAAAVGTLLSGADPNDVDVSFEVTGPIDGPSGGAALTVGVLAAVRGDDLRAGVTMTGTINPDGSIGPVTNVATKVRAAAEDGYETVLIPVGTEVEFDPATGEEIEIEELGRSLGVEVRVAPNVGVAYKAFTGNNIAPGSGSPPSRGVAVGAVARQTTDRLNRRLARLIENSDPGVITASTRQRAREAANAGQAGELALSYALGVDALKSAERETTRAEVSATFTSTGRQAAVRILESRITRLKKMARQTTAEAAKRAGARGFEQKLLVPVALGWVTYSTALLDAIQEDLDGRALNRTALIERAGVAADAGVSIEVFGPDAIEAALAGDASGPGQEEVRAFLSGYTNFLIRGGRASEQYFEKVIEATGLGAAPDYICPAFRALGREVGEIPTGTNTIEEEITQASGAISYFVIGAILVGGDSILGLPSFGIGEDITAARESKLLPAAVEGATSTVEYWASDLQSRGVEAGYPVWSSEWGLAGCGARRDAD
ncbi:MAG: S16 family serine protease, partial [Solirubrobacterales bacterium]